MTNLTSFNFQAQPISVLTINGEPWFVAKEVCYVLELPNVGQALSRLKEYEKNTIIINDGTPGNPNQAIISESGLYRLVLTSRKPQAEPFQDWVVQEVLPSIRKTGSYVTQQLSPGQLLKLQADALIAIEERQNQHEEELNEIKQFLADADNLARVYIAKGNLIPPAELTTAGKINLVVRSYCNQTNSDYASVWNALYREFKLREHIDVRTRYENAQARGYIPKSMNKLTFVVDKLALGEKFYSVVVACCVQGRWIATPVWLEPTNVEPAVAIAC